MSGGFVPIDQAARDRIAEDLTATLFVEAGAGTGKTTSLVRRVVNLVTSDRATLDRIAAITFTEAAAAELRDRIREGLEAAVRDESRARDVRARCERALRDLDQAAVQTLHGFAGSLLRERPLEAGLPPAFETLDEIKAGLRFEETWQRWLDHALEDAALAPILRRAMALGLTLGALHDAALAFHENYDLLDHAEFEDVEAPDAPLAAAALVDAAPDLERLRRFAKKGEEDALAQHAGVVLGLAWRLRGIGSDPVAAWHLLARSGSVKAGKRGNQKDWERDPSTGENACKRLKEILAGLEEQRQEDLSAARQSVLIPILRAVRRLVLDDAALRKRDGYAGFHDLLVWARNLVRDDLGARDHFRARYTHLLLDECQDTDPLQAEIALFLAEDAAPGTPAGARPLRWTDVQPATGRLFAVGDPKQSIYRFRRADIAVTRQFRERLSGSPVPLVQSFRSQRPVVEWVNHLFSGWMAERDGQVAYAPLVHRWEPPTDHARRPAVRCLGGPLDLGSVDDVRQEEAQGLAAALRQIRDEGWPVLDGPASEAAGVAHFRQARYADVCVLFPRRTSLRTLELALEDAGVPYRLEGTSLVLQTQEVCDLLACLRAIDDPADQVALVAALRSPAFACSDPDLLAFVEAGGRLDYLALGKTIGGPVEEAMAVLRDYHGRRTWTSPAALVEAFVRERRLLEVALARPRPRECWRRYRFLIDRARVFAEAAGPSLRAYLDWIDRQREEGVRVEEAVVPEADEDAVRLMTVHAAKGLEFPVVVLTGLNGGPQNQGKPVLFDRENGRVEVRLGSREARFETPGYEELAERDQRLEDEEVIRLLYVAATRARDHLLVSAYRKAGDGKSMAARIAADLDGHGHLWEPLSAAVPPGEPRAERMTGAGAGVAAGAAAAGAADGDTADARAAWEVERAALLRRQSRPSVISATELVKVVKEEAGGTGEPWRRGRAGTSLGRAVHAVLQTIDLASGAGLEDAARAQATAERVPHREAEIVRLARVALESAVVRRAVSSGRFWREVPVAAPVGAGVLEGFVDLLFEEDDGLVVVDYKTDSLESAEEVEQAAARYRLQAGAYALAVQHATGRAVKEAVLLFLHPRREEPVQDVAQLAEAARAAAAAALEGESPPDPHGLSRADR